jgi:YHS domain-containing protein
LEAHRGEERQYFLTPPRLVLDELQLVRSVAERRPIIRGVATELRDPVCGMTLAPLVLEEAIVRERRFRFCSAACRNQFLDDPGRYFTAQGGGPMPY